MLKTTLIAFVLDVSNASHQKAFVLLWSFFEVCLRQIRKYLYGNFYQSFPTIWTLTNVMELLFEANCLSFSNCLMLKMLKLKITSNGNWRLRVISLKKLYLLKIITSYLMLAHNGNRVSLFYFDYAQYKNPPKECRSVYYSTD